MSDAMSSTFPAGAVAAPLQFFSRKEHHPENGTALGFWLYLMSDCLIFACLFAVYAVVGRNYAAGPSGADLFDLNLVAVNTAMLLLRPSPTALPCWKCSASACARPWRGWW